MTTLSLSRRLLPLAALAGALLAVPARATAADDGLYRALGGRSALQAQMQDLVQRLRLDARLAPFFRDSNLEHLAAQLADQLCQLAGGPCVYEGPTMAEAHAGMDVGRADFLALAGLLQQVLEAHGVPWPAQRALLARLAPMQREIVGAR